VNPLIDHHCCYTCGNSLNDFFFYQCTCEYCGNGAHVGYNCPTQVPYFQTLPSFPQQYPCCEDCGVTHEPYQCQPKNHDYYNKQNSCYDSNSFGFDHGQPPRYTVNHPIFNDHNDLLSSRTTLMEQMTHLTSMCATANARYWKILACCDDDDDYNLAITPNEPVDSLSMGDEHLDTVPATESDEFIKSCVENLVPNPSESKGESGCDVPACFTTFTNVLFDAEYEFDSSDDQSYSDEDVPKKIFLNPLFEEEIVPMKIDQLISLRIDETDCYPEEDIHLTKRLLYDNSSSQIDLSFNPDDPMPPCIEDDDYDSERDILIREELLANYSLSLLKNESFHFDIPSFSRPSAKPPDGNTEIMNIKMMGDNSEQKVPMAGLTITRVSNQEKSLDLLSHQGLEIFLAFC
nr:hypothetical protein [Tanacetum cinerariifolium]